MLSGLSLLPSLPCSGLRWPGQAGLARAYVLHWMDADRGKRGQVPSWGPGPSNSP